MVAEEGASGGTGRRFFLTLITLAVAAAIGGRGEGHATEKPMANIADPSSQRLLDLARRRGRLPVIVGLAIADAAADDEAAIAEAQRQLLADLGVVTTADGSLKGPGISAIKLYQTIPFVALTADADAIGRLLRDRRVVSIQEDSAVPPD